MLSKRILIVDDEREIRILLQKFLQRGGFNVDVAAGVIEAKGLIAAKQYELVICDFRMPDGNGLDVFKSLGPRQKFVLITGHADVDRDQLDREGVTRVVPKPFGFSDFMLTVKEIIAS